ncbi:MAG: hypothetical protein PVH41_03675 [Anaerolineae bacterium]|jgi:hypothetical protein
MNGRRLVALGRLLASLIALCVGCGPTAEPLRREQDVSGFITDIRANGRGGVAAQIVVESHADKLLARYVIRLRKETLIFQQGDDDLRSVSFSALANKQTVQVWWAEPTTGTFPVLGTAAQIVIQ